eukprot:scaffold2471_cov115-Isochrysis_galbana.AAC.2
MHSRCPWSHGARSAGSPLSPASCPTGHKSWMGSLAASTTTLWVPQSTLHLRRSAVASAISGFVRHKAADTMPCRWLTVPPIQATVGERNGSTKDKSAAGTQSNTIEIKMRMKKRVSERSWRALCAMASVLRPNSDAPADRPLRRGMICRTFTRLYFKQSTSTYILYTIGMATAAGMKTTQKKMVDSTL